MELDSKHSDGHMHMCSTKMHAHIVLTETVDFSELHSECHVASGKFMCSVTSHSKSRFRAGRVLVNMRDACQTNGFFTDERQTLERVHHFGTDRAKLTLFAAVGNCHPPEQHRSPIDTTHQGVILRC